MGKDGKVESGDELLEVNGKKLLGLFHSDVVAILKKLPKFVQLVCSRPLLREPLTLYKKNTANSSATNFALERLVKTESDCSIGHTVTAGAAVSSRAPRPQTDAMDVISTEVQ